MRVTNRMMIDNAIQNMSDNLERYNALNEKSSTQKQFQVASDNPMAASNSLKLRSSLTTLDGYQKTASLTDDWMSATDMVFDQMQTISQKALNLIESSLNDPSSMGERTTTLTDQMNQLLQEAINTANTSENGQYLFSGNKTDIKPFEMQNANTLVYKGDQKVMQRVIGYSSQTVALNITGDQSLQPFLEKMVQARNALQADDMTALRGALDGLQSASDTISLKRSQNGASQQQVQSVSDYLDKMTIDLKSMLTKNEDVNMAEALSNLTYQETAYKSVLEVSQRAISALNLFDYLQ
jgi:flagellar hook-associated protein 3 FlgL